MKQSDTIEELEKKLNDLSEFVYNLQDNLEGTNGTKDSINEISKEITKINTKFEEMKDIKNQIFGVMALFFGIFAFISLDLGVTTGLLSYFETDNYILLSITIVALLCSQIIFFICIYHFLLVPFLYKNQDAPKSLKIPYISMFVIIILFLVPLIWLYKENSELKQNQKHIDEQVKELISKSNPKTPAK